MIRSLVVIGAVALTACSGATQTDFFDPVASDSSPTEREPGSGEPPRSSKSQQDNATAPVDRSFGDDDQGSGKGDDGPHDLPTPNACASEAEPNGNDATATKFTGCINGVLESGSDVDMLLVSAPQGASRMHLRHEDSARINYRVSDAGLPDSFPFVVTFWEEDAEIDVIPGHSYRIRLSVPFNSKKEARSYVVRVDFD